MKLASKLFITILGTALFTSCQKGWFMMKFRQMYMKTFR